MSIKDLIKSKKIKQKQIASTVRLPDDLHTKVDEIAEYLGLSRQALMLKLISESTDEAWKMIQDDLKDDVEEEFKEAKYHLLNTNKGNSVTDHNYILSKGIAAAFFNPWKKNINRIKEGDVVFLYENGKGIVAYGVGSGKTLKKDHNGRKDECFYQELSEFTKLVKPLSAKEIKKILNKNIRFLRTMTGIRDGDKLLNFIKINCL